MHDLVVGILGVLAFFLFLFGMTWPLLSHELRDKGKSR